MNEENEIEEEVAPEVRAAQRTYETARSRLAVAKKKVITAAEREYREQFIVMEPSPCYRGTGGTNGCWPDLLYTITGDSGHIAAFRDVTTARKVAEFLNGPDSA